MTAMWNFHELREKERKKKKKPDQALFIPKIPRRKEKGEERERKKKEYDKPLDGLP